MLYTLNNLFLDYFSFFILKANISIIYAMLVFYCLFMAHCPSLPSDAVLRANGTFPACLPDGIKGFSAAYIIYLCNFAADNK